MRYPNLYLIGAQKSGTTTIANYLKHHPEIAFSLPKEPALFSSTDNAPFDSYKYQEHKSNPRYYADGSTAYLYEDYAPNRIYKHAGDQIKVIVILRDPFERMISAFWHLYKRYDENRSLHRVFQDYTINRELNITLEEKRIREAESRGLINVEKYAERYDDPYWPFRYYKNSCYDLFLRKWQNLFGSDNICILSLNDLKTDASLTLSRLSTFLGIENNWCKKKLVSNRTKSFRVYAHKRMMKLYSGAGIENPLDNECVLADQVNRSFDEVNGWLEKGHHQKPNYVSNES